MMVTDSPAVWRAVAHPLRRRLIDLLAEGPRTTGDLARAFPVTRFAVMKHLRLLERTGLIVVDRRGRQRWNTLSISPGLQLSLLPGQGGSAVGQGSSRAGETSAVGPGSSLADPATLFPFHVEQHVLLDAPPGRVFDALTFNVSAWWGAPYLRSPAATNVVLEPQLGGRLYEEWGHRQGFIRGIVIAIRQDERLEVSGRIAGAGALPAALEFGLVHRSGGTRLSLVHHGVAQPAGGGRARIEGTFEAAWAELIGTRLKAFVERGTRCGITERPASPEALAGWF